jgi:hypothetical protein
MKQFSFAFPFGVCHMSYSLTPLQIAKAAEYFNGLTAEDRYAGDGHGLGDLVRIDLFVDSVKTYIVHVEFDALGKNAMFFRCDVSADSDIVIQEVAL